MSKWKSMGFFFFVLSAVTESLGDIAGYQWKNNFQGFAVNPESIMIKMLATKMESMLPLYFISGSCTGAWCLVIFRFSNDLRYKNTILRKKSVVTVKKNCNILIHLSDLIHFFLFIYLLRGVSLSWTLSHNIHTVL